MIRLAWIRHSESVNHRVVLSKLTEAPADILTSDLPVFLLNPSAGTGSTEVKGDVVLAMKCHQPESPALHNNRPLARSGTSQSQGHITPLPPLPFPVLFSLFSPRRLREADCAGAQDPCVVWRRQLNEQCTAYARVVCCHVSLLRRGSGHNLWLLKLSPSQALIDLFFFFTAKTA